MLLMTELFCDSIASQFVNSQEIKICFKWFMTTHWWVCVWDTANKCTYKYISLLYYEWPKHVVGYTVYNTAIYIPVYALTDCNFHNKQKYVLIAKALKLEAESSSKMPELLNSWHGIPYTRITGPSAMKEVTTLHVCLVITALHVQRFEMEENASRYDINFIQIITSAYSNQSTYN
jgi:hypothetical protein